MKRSSTIAYALEDTVAPGENVEITVGRDDSASSQLPSIPFRFFRVLSPTSVVDPDIFDGGEKSIWLDATFDTKSLEIRIDNIEGRSIKRGQSFALKTFKQLIELAPECKSILLYNITNHNTAAALEKVRVSEEVIPHGVLLRSLSECGFQRMVRIELGGPAYLCVRAFKH